MNETAIVVKLIEIIPSILLLLIVLAILYYYRDEIQDVLKRVGSVKLFGLEAQFGNERDQLVKAAISYKMTDQLSQAVASFSTSPPPADVLNAVIQRADKMRDKLHGTRILWIDDHFLGNANIFRFLNAYGVTIDKASTTEEALSALKWASGAFEAVVTDMVRDGDETAGLKLIEGAKKLEVQNPILILVAKLDESLGTPIGARAITDSPIELIQQYMDILDRLPTDTADSP